jgi:hypothetical protein
MAIHAPQRTVELAGVRSHAASMFRFNAIFTAVIFTALAWPALAQISSPPPATAPTPLVTAEPLALTLEREKFEYQKQLETEKLAVERLKAWATGGSILLPLALGILTLAWQTRTANKLKDREAKDMFELKAAEILFEGDNTRATKNRAKALTVLFPERFPKDFGDAFEPSQFGGPRFEAKLEVFKAACTKVSTPEEVYRVWHALFPGDNWIKPLVSGLAEKHNDDTQKTT